MSIYFDYAAATPMSDEVLTAMQPYWQQKFHNPSAIYLSGRDARQDLEQQRAIIASQLGARPAEIIFASGATEANNLAIQGVMQNFPEGEVLVSSVEHESVVAPASKFNYKLIPVNEAGVIDIAKLSHMINPKTVLVSVMYVNNEIGAVEPLKEAAELVKMVRKQRLAAGNKVPIYLHTDAAQAGNYFDLHASRLGVDMMSINGAKLYGPKQSGALYVKAGVLIKPLILGGGQEFGLRSGTENIALCAGLAKALQVAQADRQDEAERIKILRQKFESQLTDKFPKANVNGNRHRAPHISSVTFDGLDNERLMMQLDELGIICAVGSACSASSDEPSHVLSAIGLGDEQARSTLRFSFGRQTTDADIDKCLDALSKILQ